MFFCFLGKNGFQNLQRFGFFKPMQVDGVVVQDNFEQDLPFVAGESFLFAVKFEAEQFPEKMGFMVRQTADAV